MIRNMINGFCMALADSVPGVSGGTVAFIMGFYDRFIGSVHDVVFGSGKKRKAALLYLIKLGMGWAAGMILAVLILSSLFDSYIYTVSSVFIGFIAGSIPIIIMEEKDSFSNVAKGILFCIAGILLVVGISYINGKTGSASMNLGHFSIGLGIKLFLIGMVAISAMFLPGISGSTLLLIFGAYIPVITAIKACLKLDLSYVPSLIFFGLGVIAGAVSVVKLIKLCLEKFHVETMYCILGMMIGSFYAIVKGPTTLKEPRPAMGFSSFSIVACIVGVILVLAMHFARNIKLERS